MRALNRGCRRGGTARAAMAAMARRSRPLRLLLEARGIELRGLAAEL